MLLLLRQRRCCRCYSSTRSFLSFSLFFFELLQNGITSLFISMFSSFISSLFPSFWLSFFMFVPIQHLIIIRCQRTFYTLVRKIASNDTHTYIHSRTSYTRIVRRMPLFFDKMAASLSTKSARMADASMD